MSSENTDVEMQDAPIFAGLERETEEEQTPRPKKKAPSKRKGDDSESESDCESDSFQTPRALKKRVAKRAEFLAESDVNFMDIVEQQSCYLATVGNDCTHLGCLLVLATYSSRK
jgi:hypothetical protein